jgi:acetoin utilization protein AcuB
MSETAAAVSALRVRDYMSSNPESLAPEDRLLDAELLIRRAGVRHIPVLSGGTLVGLLSERDVRRYAPSILDSTPEEYNRIFEQTRIERVMTRDVGTTTPTRRWPKPPH